LGLLADIFAQLPEVGSASYYQHYVAGEDDARLVIAIRPLPRVQRSRKRAVLAECARLLDERRISATFDLVLEPPETLARSATRFYGRIGS
jgi:hypothetical protein